MRRRPPSSLLALAARPRRLAAAVRARPSTPPDLRATLTKLHNRLGPAAGAYVVDLADGTDLYSHRPTLALAPASNEKLFMTATALLRFGAAGTLTTTRRGRARRRCSAPTASCAGDLYLVGGGDPTLDDAGLRTLADQVAAAGVSGSTAAVVGDESFFDTLRGGPDSGYRPDNDLGGWLTALAWRPRPRGRVRPGARGGRRLARAAEGAQGHATRARRGPGGRRRAPAAGVAATPSRWRRCPRRRSPR